MCRRGVLTRRRPLNWRNTMYRKIVLTGLMCIFAATPVLAQEEESEEEKKKLWENQLGLSFVKTTGNSENQNFGLDFNSKREATPWGFEFRAFFNDGEDAGVKTVEQYYLGGRAFRKISERWDVFGGLNFAKDEFAGFELRTVVEVGVTYHALAGPKHHLSFDGGLTYTDEDRIDPNPDESWPGAVLGLAYEYKFSEKSSLTQTVVFYPNFDESDDWRLNAETGVTAALTDLLGLKFGYLYRYRNLPIGDADSTDTTTTMSVVLTF
jgi:putative salt-induced outer membrane protein YdiY